MTAIGLLVFLGDSEIDEVNYLGFRMVQVTITKQHIIGFDIQMQIPYAVQVLQALYLYQQRLTLLPLSYVLVVAL